MKATLKQAIHAGKKIGVNFEVISPDTLKRGINVELEHGKRHGRTNITNDSILLSATIAMAHLEEFPDYYDALEKMELRLKKKWHGRRKPSVFI